MIIISNKPTSKEYTIYFIYKPNIPDIFVISFEPLHGFSKFKRVKRLEFFKDFNYLFQPNIGDFNEICIDNFQNKFTSKMTGNYESRSSSHRFLVGNIEDHIPDHMLPTNRDILKYLLYKKHDRSKHAKFSSALKPLVSCKLNSNKESVCGGAGGCLSSGDKCVVRAVKEVWEKAGIITMGVESIQAKVSKLNSAYDKILKHKSKTSASAEQERVNFDKFLDSFF